MDETMPVLPVSGVPNIPSATWKGLNISSAFGLPTTNSWLRDPAKDESDSSLVTIWPQTGQGREDSHFYNAPSSTPNDSLPLFPVYTSQDLWTQNEIFARNMVPAMIFIALLMAIGVPGNCLVVYVYGFRFKSTTQNVLIVSLACLDLVMCMVAMPTEIADIRFHHTFSSVLACKFLRFITMFVNSASCLTLIGVAYDRHKRITQPLSRQMTPRVAKLWAALNLVGALFVSWPTFVMTGLKPSQTKLPGLHGTDCSYSEEFINTKYPLIFNGVLAIGFLVDTAVLSILYYRIWKAAKSRKMNMAKRYTITSISDSSHIEHKGDNTLAGNAHRDFLRLLRKQPSLDNATFARHQSGKLRCPKWVPASKEDISENGTTFTNISMSSVISGRRVSQSLDRNNTVGSKYRVNGLYGSYHQSQSSDFCSDKSVNTEFESCNRIKIKHSQRRNLAGELISSCPDLVVSSNVAFGSVNRTSSQELCSAAPIYKPSTYIGTAPSNQCRPNPVCPHNPCPVPSSSRFSTNEKAKDSVVESKTIYDIPNTKIHQDIETDSGFPDEVQHLHSDCVAHQPDQLSKNSKQEARDSFNFDDSEISLATYIGCTDSRTEKEKTRSSIASTNYLELDILTLTNASPGEPIHLTAQSGRNYSAIRTSHSIHPSSSLTRELSAPCGDPSDDEDDRRISIDLCMESFSHLIGPRSMPIALPTNLESKDIDGVKETVPLSRKRSSLCDEVFQNNNTVMENENDQPHGHNQSRQSQRTSRYSRINDPDTKHRDRAGSISEEVNFKSRRTERASIDSRLSVGGLSEDFKQAGRNETRSQSLSSAMELDATLPASKVRRRLFFGSLDKTTVVALAVSCVFVLSFLPYLVVMSIRGLDKSYYAGLNWASLCAYQIFVRFYFLNSSSNPILYGLFNPNFRRECRATWRRMIGCCSTKEVKDARK